MRIRWSDKDRYFGPFTYAHEPKYRKFAIMLGSGREEYAGCRIRFGIGAHTLILALPPIIKPLRTKVYYSSPDLRAKIEADGRDPFYFDEHEREYGFTFFEGDLHVHHGAQTHSSDTTKSWIWFYPWREHGQVRHSLYDLKGEHFADLPQGRYSNNQWTAEQALKSACPVAKFTFQDFDGEQIVATTYIEEREWKRGKGIFCLLYIGRNTIHRYLELRFSAEVGRRKGSWKGGTVGHSIRMLPGELHSAAFRRYCMENKLTFVGAALEEVKA